MDVRGRGRCLILGNILEFYRGAEVDHEIPQQNNRSPGRDLKSGHTEYEAGVLTIRRRSSIVSIIEDSVFSIIRTYGHTRKLTLN
jgi:hypothetical protein